MMYRDAPQYRHRKTPNILHDIRRRGAHVLCSRHTISVAAPSKHDQSRHAALRHNCCGTGTIVERPGEQPAIGEIALVDPRERVGTIEHRARRAA